jgi:hypothetical protein
VREDAQPTGQRVWEIGIEFDERVAPEERVNVQDLIANEVAFEEPMTRARQGSGVSHARTVFHCEAGGASGGNVRVFMLIWSWERCEKMEEGEEQEGSNDR